MDKTNARLHNDDTIVMYKTEPQTIVACLNEETLTAYIAQ